MKKLLVLFVAAAFGLNAVAQGDVLQGNAQEAQRQVKAQDEYVIMVSGKVWHMKDGVKTLVSSDIMLGGTSISPTGTVVTKGGAKSVLKEGDKVSPDGKVTEAPAKKESDSDPKKYMQEK